MKCTDCSLEAVPTCQWCMKHCQKHHKDSGQHHPITKRRITGYKRLGEKSYEIHLDEDIDTMSVYELRLITSGESN